MSGFQDYFAKLPPEERARLRAKLPGADQQAMNEQVFDPTLNQTSQDQEQPARSPVIPAMAFGEDDPLLKRGPNSAFKDKYGDALHRHELAMEEAGFGGDKEFVRGDGSPVYSYKMSEYGPVGPDALLAKSKKTGDKPRGAGGGKPSPPGDSKPQGGQFDFASMLSGINDAGDAGKLPPEEQQMYDDYKASLLARKGKFNLKPLAALLDSWYGGNLASAVKDPETNDEIDDKVMTLDMKLAARRAQEQEAQKDRNLKTTGMIMKHANDRTLQKHEQQINEYKTKLLLAQVRGAQGGKGKAQMTPKMAMLAGFLGNNKGSIAKAAEQHKDPKAKAGNPNMAIRHITQTAEQIMRDPKINEKGQVSYVEALELAQNDFALHGYKTEDEAAGEDPNERLFDGIFGD